MEERRKAPRYPVAQVIVHQCILNQLGREIWLNVTALDFSSIGLSLISPESLNAGESLYLLLTIQPNGKPPRDLEVNGVTAHCRPLEDGRWRVGVKFIDLLPDEQTSWNDYLRS